jgi:hypothetical protein
MSSCPGGKQPTQKNWLIAAILSLAINNESNDANYRLRLQVIKKFDPTSK